MSTQNHILTLLQTGVKDIHAARPLALFEQAHGLVVELTIRLQIGRDRERVILVLGKAMRRYARRAVIVGLKGR
jgi:hypothetical protein